MTDQATHTTTAGGSPLDGGVRPRAWAIFVDGANARMWSTLQPHVQKLADAEGLDVTPLYDGAALDNARQAIYEAEAAQLTAPLRAELARLREALSNIVGAADMHPVHLEQAIGRARRILGA